MHLILDIFGILIQVYSYLIFAYILIGYFPDARHTKIYQFIANLCEPWLNVFRFAEIRGFSIAPILAILTLELLYTLLTILF